MIFLIAHFPHIPVFLKIINCTYFYRRMHFIICKQVRPNMIQVDQLIFYSYYFKTGVHFQFYHEILKVI